MKIDNNLSFLARSYFTVYACGRATFFELAVNAGKQMDHVHVHSHSLSVQTNLLT